MQPWVECLSKEQYNKQSCTCAQLQDPKNDSCMEEQPHDPMDEEFTKMEYINWSR